MERQKLTYCSQSSQEVCYQQVTKPVPECPMKKPCEPQSPNQKPCIPQVPECQKPKPCEPQVPESPSQRPGKPQVPEIPLQKPCQPQVPERPVQKPCESQVTQTPNQKPCKPWVPDAPSQKPCDPQVPERPVQKPCEPQVPQVPDKKPCKPSVPDFPSQKPQEPEPPIQKPCKPSNPDPSPQKPCEPQVPDCPKKPCQPSNPDPPAQKPCEPQIPDCPKKPCQPPIPDVPAQKPCEPVIPDCPKNPCKPPVQEWPNKKPSGTKNPDFPCTDGGNGSLHANEGSFDLEADKNIPTVLPMKPFNPQADAEVLHKAMKGLGTKEKSLIDVLCGRTCSQRLQIVQAYKKACGKDLILVIKGETSGHLERVLVALCQSKADFLATEINCALKALKTDEATVAEIICSQTCQDIAAIRTSYQQLYGRPVETDVEEQMSGDLKTFLISIIRGHPNKAADVDPELQGIRKCTDKRSDYLAKRLYEAMKGLGTRDRTLIRLIVTRCDVDLGNIKIAFENIYGKTLASCVASDVSFSYKKAMLTLIG